MAIKAFFSCKRNFWWRYLALFLSLSLSLSFACNKTKKINFRGKFHQSIFLCGVIQDLGEDEQWWCRLWLRVVHLVSLIQSWWWNLQFFVFSSHFVEFIFKILINPNNRGQTVKLVIQREMILRFTFYIIKYVIFSESNLCKIPVIFLAGRGISLTHLNSLSRLPKKNIHFCFNLKFFISCFSFLIQKNSFSI